MYDEKGNLVQKAYPSGFTIENVYNDRGFLIAINNAADGYSIYVPGDENARGQLLNSINSNGTIYTTYNYDDFGMPASKLTGTSYGGSDIQNQETYFNRFTGNLEYRKDNNYSLTEDFTYDPVFKNRLSSWVVNGGQPQYTMTYADNNGNIYTKSDFTSAGNPYIYDSDDKPHAVKSVTSPLQVPAETSQNITYNVLNKVSEIIHSTQGLQYAIEYGPDERRVKSQYYCNNILAKTKYYIGDDYEVEINHADGSFRKLHYLPGGGLFVMDQAGNNVMYYVQTDYQGSWSSVTTSAGSFVEQYSFDPWGKRRNHTNWSINVVPSPFQFDRGYTGHEHLDAFGLINMNGRVYDPVIARFLSPDNYVQDPDNTQGFNRYTYCLNNPLVYSDPSGDIPILIPLVMIAMQAYIAGDIASNSPVGFWGGFALGAVTGGLSMAIGGAIGPILAGTGIFSEAINLAFPAALGGGFSYGFQSILTGQPFDWKSWGLNVGMAALTGGIEGGYSAYAYNALNPTNPINIWTGKPVYKVPFIPPMASRKDFLSIKPDSKIQIDYKSQLTPIYTDSEQYFDGSNLVLCDFYSDGSSQIRNSWDAISGPWGEGALPNYTYTIEREPFEYYADKGFVNHNFGFAIELSPRNLPNGRGHFYIHPDGNVHGTRGCIGLTGPREDLINYYNTIKAYYQRYGSMKVNVYIP